MQTIRKPTDYNPDEFEHEPTHPHPDAPTDEHGNPVDPYTDERICGLPKKNPDENTRPYCRRSGYWIRSTGACFEHMHRLDHHEPPRDDD